MNIALPALVVFACLLPGFVVRSRLKRVESTSLDYSPFGRVVSEAVFWAALLHLLWITVFCPLAGHRVDLGLVLQLLSSNLGIHGDAVKTIAGQIDQVELYFATLYAASYLVPAAIRKVITVTGADRLGQPLAAWLRFEDAPWYYLLTGADFAPKERPDLIMATALVSVAGEPILFKGVLNDFYFKSDGTLDRLILQDTMRRPLSKDKATEDHDGQDRFYPIDGDSFVIQYEQVLTLNIQYVKLTPAD